MLENYIMQVRRPKGVSSEREAFVSRGARASAAARLNKFTPLKNSAISLDVVLDVHMTHAMCNETEQYNISLN